MGKNWHIRGLNDKGDFSFVICDSVHFYLKQLKPIIDYERDKDKFVKITHIAGKSLVFMFVRGDGNCTNYNTFYQLQFNIKKGDCKTWTLDWTRGLDSGLDSWTGLVDSLVVATMLLPSLFCPYKKNEHHLEACQQFTQSKGRFTI